MGRSIANIITDNFKTKFDITVNKCSCIEEIDKSLPTLIIGIENAKKTIKDFNILIKEYKEQKLWWTFNKNERMSDYEEDLKSFYNMAISNVVKDVKYIYVDALECDYNRTKHIFKYLFESDDLKVCYNDNNNFLFVYSQQYNVIWGFSLSTMKFYGIKENTLNRLIKKINNSKFLTNFSKIPHSVKMNVDNKVHNNIILSTYF